MGLRALPDQRKTRLQLINGKPKEEMTLAAAADEVGDDSDGGYNNENLQPQKWC